MIVKRIAKIADVWPDAPKGADLNDCLQHDPGVLHEVIQSAVEPQPEDLVTAWELREKIYNRMYGVGGEASDGLGIHALESHIRIRWREWTVVSGWEGDGKTTWLGDRLVEWAAAGVKGALASLEIEPYRTFETALRQAIGVSRPMHLDGDECGHPDVAWFDRAVSWLDERIFAYRKTGSVKLTEVLKLFTYLARRYGVRLFVIDSLMMLSDDKDDRDMYLRQGQMCQALNEFTRATDSHLFLVAHPKKAQDEKTQYRKPVREQDVKGAGEFLNMCFNFFVYHQNREKLARREVLLNEQQQLEQKRQQTKADMDKLYEISCDLMELSAEHDAMFFCKKQRNSVTDRPRPARKLYFIPNCKQVTHDPERRIRQHVV